MANTLHCREIPGPAPQFSREQVFAAALELIDAGPPGSFSLRKLAARLGVNANTLYGYAPSKDALLVGAAGLALAAVHEELPPDAPWQDRVRTAVREVHAVSARHPNLAAILVATPVGPGTFGVRERLLAALTDAGLDDTAALHAFGTCVAFAVGAGAARAATTGQRLPQPPAAYPTLARLAARYDEHLSDDAFEFGLDALIGGIEQRV